MSRKPGAHPADKFCRDIINRHPVSLEIADKFYHDRAIVTGKCPDWCALPSSLIAWYLAGSNEKQAVLNILNQKTVYQLTAALLWSRNKMVYRFDKTLSDTLTAMPLDGKIPFDILDSLPYPCVYVEHDMTLGGYRTIGFFARLDWGTKGDVKLLRFDFLKPYGEPISTFFPVSGGTIKDSILALANRQTEAGIAEKVFTEDDVHNSPVAQSIIECVNLLLYLCSEKPDMPDDAKLKTRRSRDFYGNPKRAATWEVGTRIGAALRKAREAEKESEETAPSEQSRSTPRPHLRRAHWHSFWTGKRDSKERKLVLRWLPPIAVNIDGEELPTVVTPVKKDDKGGQRYE